MDDEKVVDINMAKENLNLLFKNMVPQVSKLLVVFFLLWIASGVYVVAPNEVGIIKRFGKFAGEKQPGPHWHFPYPIETVMKPKVTTIYREEIGFRTISPGPPARYRAMPAEAHMLTGDENILSVEFIVQYKINDPVKFLFNVKNPGLVLKKVAEASIREVIGGVDIDEVLTTGKQRIQSMTMDLMQEILDTYDIGFSVVAVQLQDVNPPKEVIASFKDVASAREDKEKMINQAQSYENELIPKAKGEAAEVINQSVGYRESRISRAEGDVNRFEKMRIEYQKNKDIIGTRIYLEGMQEILSKPKLVIMEKGVGGNMLPLLSIDKLVKEGR